MWLSSITLPPWLPDFPPKAIPSAISSLTSPGAISLQSTADLTLGLLPNPYISAPSHHAFQRTCTPVWDTYGCVEDHLCGSHSIQTVTDQLLHSLTASNASLHPKQCPKCGGLTPASVPSPSKYRSSPAYSPLSHFLLSPCQVLCGSILSFPGIRDSCMLSAGVLKDLLNLKMYSWNICGGVLHVYYSSAILSSPLHRIISWLL